MKRWKIVFIIVICIISGLSYFSYKNNPDILEEFLEKENLSQDFKEALVTHKKYHKISDNDIKNNLRNFLKSNANDDYKKAYINSVIKTFPTYAKFNIVLDYPNVVRYDPKYAISVLEEKLDETGADALLMTEKFQLLVLWQIYEPQSISSPKYNTLAESAHNTLMEYFTDKKWQYYRQEEYQEAIKDNYIACYNDLKCLLDIIPYWSDWEIDGAMNVIIPCNVALKYHKVFYYDVAGGGHGAQTMFTSDCNLYDKYTYPKDLAEYMNMLNAENMMDSDGSIRFLYYAQSFKDAYKTQYDPDFEMEEQENWLNFPYTEWAIQSYYNWKIFNSVINFGIGYKKAVERLTDYYQKTFNISYTKAHNSALYALNPPSSTSWARIDDNNLNYLLLTGADWEKIKSQISSDRNINELFELTLEYPQTLQKLISLAKGNNSLNINISNEFGKTPLMVAAQYGFLKSVQILIENGADINLQTNDSDCRSDYENLCMKTGKRSALMYALQEGQYEVVKYLLEKNADINLTDTQGKNACHYLKQEAPLRNPQNLVKINGALFSNEERQPVFSDTQRNELSILLKCEN